MADVADNGDIRVASASVARIASHSAPKWDRVGEWI